VSDGIYASDPDAAEDSQFEPAALRHLVVGNRGRLLDARRTPVSVSAVVPGRGAFVVRIDAFEDAGAEWELPLEDVGQFQFERGAAVGGEGAVAELERAWMEFDRELVIEAGPAVAGETRRRVAAERKRLALGERARRALPRGSARLALPRVDLARRVAERRGDGELFALLEETMRARDLGELEREFAARFVSNPRSGELVKGHAIVMAELGLCPFVGKVVRDPELFAEPWTKERRAAHLVTRLAFVQALLGDGSVTLFRGAAVDGPLPDPAPSSFVSATFSREVATSHFEGGPSTRTAVLWRQEVPVARVAMTFLETRAMNERFLEAEAVLVGEPGNRAF
jgi:hypothetical protein